MLSASYYKLVNEFPSTAIRNVTSAHFGAKIEPKEVTISVC